MNLVCGFVVLACNISYIFILFMSREALCYLVVRPSVRPLTSIYVTRFLFSGGISMTVGTNIQHVTGHRWKGFQGQRSKVKVTARPNAILWRRLTFQGCDCGIEAHLPWL